MLSDSEEGITYTVKEGDTFKGICSEVGGTKEWKAALKYNPQILEKGHYDPQTECVLIHPGENIYVPSFKELIQLSGLTDDL